MQGHVETKDFHRAGGGQGRSLRHVNRFDHGAKLKESTERAFVTYDKQRHEAAILSDEELRATGSIIVLEGENSTHPLKLEALTANTGGRGSRPKWCLLSVRESTGEKAETATVWVADDFRHHFLRIFEDYLNDEKKTKNGLPRNQELVANISRIRSVVLEDLWTSQGEPPKSGCKWWELWLDANSPHLADWETFIARSKLEVRTNQFRLRDRLIVWVKANWYDLQTLPFISVPLTEIREPQFIDTIEDLTLEDQAEYVEDLRDRVEHAPAERRSGSTPTVCLLDTGVFRAHILLSDSLSSDDMYSIFGGSGADVHPSGHGTAMAGLALFGSLDPLLTGTDRVTLRHRLESVRMKAGRGEKSKTPLDYGPATAEAVSLPEINQPRRSRVFCLTLSTSPDKPGEPTLWSSSVDALAVGTNVVREGDELQLLSEPDLASTRLLVVAAGNVPVYRFDYRKNSMESPIQDPAQAWNALTVGAYTELTQIPSHPQYAGWNVVAESGDISPHTRTSVDFGAPWPIKPDICMEGGNVLWDGEAMFEDRLPLLSLRSTGHRSDNELTSANATSAATAQAARLAALVWDRYPSYWPETVRGLLTHSAEWTDSMKQQVSAERTKHGRLKLLRQFGWGVPAEDAVLNSALNAVTLITQDQFVPFSGNKYSVRSFRLHPLPWPKDVLQSLGETEVRLRITLSYFVEPSASRRGWRNKYQYASHGLRFDLQGRTEDQSSFIRRVNREARGVDVGSRSHESQRWFLGERGRHLGSLHQDEWIGPGVELAHCSNIAVYPVGGWWKNNRNKDRQDLPVRYSLLVSLQTNKQAVDLYTPIATQLKVPVGIEIPTV
ncbi:hypothetical protein CCHOA_09865 [Corynebacterium choanae]|uniref:Peptidase S8/S53 domain-containing protein n=1 Tax=Corynebacterium choanae TaxID=1862358 RepID=A0A3G6J8N8_9CORY|nr:hypothetical protein CCHOA_09865 [Corynebacterium choanae]